MAIFADGVITDPVSGLRVALGGDCRCFCPPTSPPRLQLEWAQQREELGLPTRTQTNASSSQEGPERRHRIACTRRQDPYITVGEIFVWLLFFALLVPVGFVGWAIGHSTAGGTRTRTVTVAASALTTTATAKTTTATKATPSPSATGPVAKGKAVFLANPCGSCHTFKAAGSTGKIGPDLDAKPAIDAKKDHMPLAGFVRQSIVKPNAYISPGYPKGLMPRTFAKTLSKTQLADLVAFITAAK